MKTWRFNGESWYCDDRGLWKRVRQWFIWVGGWEKANGAGWEPLLGHRLRSVAPLSVLGGRVTYFSWGLQVRLSRAYLVLTWRPTRKVYVSVNGTPTEAHCWLWNPPKEVIGE